MVVFGFVELGKWFNSSYYWTIIYTGISESCNDMLRFFFFLFVFVENNRTVLCAYIGTLSVFDVGDDARVEGLVVTVGGGECCVSCGFRIVDVVVVCPESAGWVPVADGLHSGSDVELFSLS